jgi:chemotaxis protein CheC
MAFFSELQKDALAELFNIGIGAAADTLSQIIHSEVQLFIPQVQLVAISDLIADYRSGDVAEICGISQHFDGEFGAISARVFFPIAKTVKIAELALPQRVELDEDIGTFEKEAITEVGNIILNSCLGTFARMLESSLSSSKPDFYKGPIEYLFNDISGQKVHFVTILLRIEFEAQEEKIPGELVFIVDPDSLNYLKRHLDQFISSIG